MACRQKTYCCLSVCLLLVFSALLYSIYQFSQAWHFIHILCSLVFALSWTNQCDLCWHFSVLLTLWDKAINKQFLIYSTYFLGNIECTLRYVSTFTTQQQSHGAVLGVQVTSNVCSQGPGRWEIVGAVHLLAYKPICVIISTVWKSAQVHTQNTKGTGMKATHLLNPWSLQSKLPLNNVCFSQD